MTLTRIQTEEDLHHYLHAALQLEHATIPVYLTALYSIHPDTNPDACQVIRVVAVEEMLHLTLVANILNAVGGEPDLTRKGFVPDYPTALPDGESDFSVSLQRFSPEAIETFLNIERPRKAPDEGQRMISVQEKTGASGKAHRLLAVRAKDDSALHFYSIGEFYEEIDRGLQALDEQKRAAGEELFTGDPARQITPDFYYSGGGEIIAVTDLESARRAIRLIAEQGEGHGDSIYDDDEFGDELSHYYRFDQIIKGRYYRHGDKPNEPSGGPVEVDWDAVYPIEKDLKVNQLPEGSEVRQAAESFNQAYTQLLEQLSRAYGGEPDQLEPAVGAMFRIKEMADKLIRNPIPDGGGAHAAPTFEIPGV